MDTRYCPGCARSMDRVRRCRRCGYETEGGAPTVRELLDGKRAAGLLWDDVDLHAYVAAVLGEIEERRR